MGVLIDNGSALEMPIGEGEIRDICARVLASEGVSRECEVSVSIVGDDEMRALNAEWRGIDRVTDVLSFECDSAFGDDLPEGEPVELGDIILAPCQIARQAPGFGTTPADEFRLMLVHGMLHLLGYDHIADEEAEAMEAREDGLLRELAVARGDDPELIGHARTTRHEDD